MNVSWVVWAVTLAGFVAMLAVDMSAVVRKPRHPTTGESVAWVLGYIALAVLFGLGIWFFSGSEFSGQFFAGWLTEYSLSVDNLFVFVIIMGRFAVPPQLQQKGLLFGVILALVLRGAVIAVGAALIHRFIWVFFLFGAFLFYTAVKLFHGAKPSADSFVENRLVRALRRVVPIADGYQASTLTTRSPHGRLILTPMFVLLVAIGTTDVLFALDSIPAIFGLTTEPYLVFSSNVFALMGLRQLYFLLGDLLQRLRYLSYGLGLMLAFIGVKLVLSALHQNSLPFLNHGQPIGWAKEIPIWLSLPIIGGLFVLTTVASLITSQVADRRAARAAASTEPAAGSALAGQPSDEAEAPSA